MVEKHYKARLLNRFPGLAWLWVATWAAQQQWLFDCPDTERSRTISAFEGCFSLFMRPHRSSRQTHLVGLLALATLLPASISCSYWECRQAKAIARGNDLFEMHCSGCHSRRRLDLEKVPPDLHGIFDRRFLPSGRSATDGVVRSTILTGRSGIMPSFEGSLSDEDIQDIILYLHTLKPPPAATSPATGTVSEVGAAFSGRRA